MLFRSVLLAGAAKELGKLPKIKVDILGPKEVAKLGMGSFMQSEPALQRRRRCSEDQGEVPDHPRAKRSGLPAGDVTEGRSEIAWAG